MKAISIKNNEFKHGNSKKTFLLMLAAFALPVILAKLALQFQWLDYGVTNKGNLLEQATTMEQLSLSSPKLTNHWLIMLTMPNDCSEFCQRSLQSVFNTYIALGKDKPRLKAVALSPNDYTDQQQKALTKEDWTFLISTPISKQVLTESQVILVDPLGNLVLSHPLPKDASQLSFFGKQVLADMKKLLKYSKVG